MRSTGTTTVDRPTSEGPSRIPRVSEAGCLNLYLSILKRRSWARIYLQTEDSGTVLLGGHPPHGPKPQRHGATRVLPDGVRGLMTAARTLQEYAAQQPILLTPIARTPKPTRPAEAEKILPTSLLRGKTGCELRQVSRVVLHSAAMRYTVVPEPRETPNSHRIKEHRCHAEEHFCQGLEKAIMTLICSTGERNEQPSNASSSGRQ